MPNYRLYFLRDDERIFDVVDLVRASDDAAIAAAQKLRRGAPVELWAGVRKVARFERSVAAVSILAGHTVLVLEDDFLQAEETAHALRQAEAKISGPFPDEASALRSIEEAPPSAAIIDIHLGAGPSFETARSLQKSGTPFIFVTGYIHIVPIELRDVLSLNKPVELRRVVRSLASLLKARPG